WCEVAGLSKTVGKPEKGGKPGKEMALFSDKMCQIKVVGMEFVCGVGSTHLHMCLNGCQRKNV
ncbi:MAG: hypothetical protein ACXWBP_09600, partial [Limisphaerales bacterium]